MRTIIIGIENDHGKILAIEKTFILFFNLNRKFPHPNVAESKLSDLETILADDLDGIDADIPLIVSKTSDIMASGNYAKSTA